MSDERMAYIVGGDTGEYSDHRAWWVRAFLDKAEADALCQRLNDWCKERGFLQESDRTNVPYSARNRGEHPPEDPEFDVDYTGTRYYVVEIPVSEAGKFKIVGR